MFGWYFEPLTHGRSNLLPMVYWTPYPWYIEPHTHDILTPYPWYFEPSTHGILNLLPMVYRTPYPWYFEPPTHGILNPLLVKMRGFNLLCWGSKCNYRNLTVGSKYPWVDLSRVQNTIWQRYVKFKLFTKSDNSSYIQFIKNYVLIFNICRVAGLHWCGLVIKESI